MVFLKDPFLVLYYSFYTTLLGKVISDSSSSHKPYADDTQLYMSFSAVDLSHNIVHLEQTVSNVHNWMSSNFLSLNPSKTEFLVIGLPKQLEKLNYPSTPLPNDVILSPSWESSLIVIQLFVDHISAVSKSWLYHIRHRRIRNTIDRTTACTIAT